MNDPRQQTMENYNRHLIGLDDTFQFTCRNCGKCCKNREDLLLNSRDIFNIAAVLGLTTKEAIEKYCETYVGDTSRMPLLRLLPVGKSKTCPLLAGSKCSVHSLKPTVCALFPLGRVVADSEEKNGGATAPGTQGEVQYVLSPATCGSAKKKITVRAWLEMYNISTNDVFFIQWNQNIFALSYAVKELEKKAGGFARAMDMLWGSMYAALYVMYDTKKEFLPQYEDNMKKIRKALVNIRAML